MNVKMGDKIAFRLNGKYPATGFVTHVYSEYTSEGNLYAVQYEVLLSSDVSGFTAGDFVLVGTEEVIDKQ